MVIKTRKNWKDFAEFSDHSHPRPHLSRRDFLGSGLATGALSVVLPQLVVDSIINQAHAAAPANCPAPVRNPGAIAQIFSEGGPTMGARFISEAQAASMNAGMAANYGISGQANLMKLGPNMVIDKTSPFGFTILQGPPGYPGGATAWQANVLSKISGGAHLGPFNQDDGAGQDTGLLGGVSPFKSSQMGKDLKINVQNKLATWANGLPSASVGSASPANLAKTFSLSPPAAGLTNTAAMNATSDAINSITTALSGIFGTNTRKAASVLSTNAGCAFYGNAALADPNFGSQLFTPANIPALTAKVTVANLTNSEQGQLAAFYQAGMGVAGGVIMEFGGRDYHGGDPQSDIAPKDIEEARSIVMFLAACDAAQSRGAMLYFSNGQAIANGTQAVTATINGQNSNINAPVAQDDAGGAYNAGLIIFYDPKGAAPSPRFTGTVNSTDGSVRIDPNVGSSKEAVAGLYLSALSFINGGTIPQSALDAMKASGVAANPANIVVI